MEQKFGEAPDDYLEYSSRVKMIRIEPDGFIFEINCGLAPSVRTLSAENFARSLREVYGVEAGDARLLKYMPPSFVRSLREVYGVEFKKSSQKSRQKAKRRSSS